MPAPCFARSTPSRRDPSARARCSPSRRDWAPTCPSSPPTRAVCARLGSRRADARASGARGARGAARAAALRREHGERRTDGSPRRASRSGAPRPSAPCSPLDALSDWSSIAPLAMQRLRARRRRAASIDRGDREAATRPRLRAGADERLGVQRLRRAAARRRRRGAPLRRRVERAGPSRAAHPIGRRRRPRRRLDGIAASRRLPAHEFANFQRCHIALDCRSLPRRPMAGHDTLDVGIVVRIHAGECARSPGQN